MAGPGIRATAPHRTSFLWPQWDLHHITGRSSAATLPRESTIRLLRGRYEVYTGLFGPDPASSLTAPWLTGSFLHSCSARKARAECVVTDWRIAAPFSERVADPSCRPHISRDCTTVLHFLGGHT